MHLARACLVGALLAAPPAFALEFRSVAASAAVLYDAPSLNAKKLLVASRGYPLEVAVVLEGWVKVRDAGGALAWAENKSLSDKRTVLVKIRLAEIRQAPAETSPLLFRAEQNVVLELIEPAGGGWIKVRHRDGLSGFVKAEQVWGA